MSRVAICLSSGVAVVFALVFSFDAPLRAASFQGIGFAPGAGPYSIAAGVSADGSVVVGWSDVVTRSPEPHPDRFAFRWTKAGGMQILNPDDTWDESANAAGVSADGTVISGYRTYRTYAGSYERRAFRWTATGGMELLYTDLSNDFPPEDRGTYASGMSGDGTVVVGHYVPWDTPEERAPFPGPPRVLQQHSRAMRWSRIGVEKLYPLLGNSAAVATSYDGSVTVGWREIRVGEVPYPTEACIWSERDGFIGLGTLPGATESSAVAVSADGSVVVGWSGSDGDARAFRWTAADGMVGLDLRRSNFALRPSFALSADGSVMVGGSWSNEDTAFVWDAEHGARNLKQILTEAGLDLSGWTLEHATGISGDGMTIVGYGRNPDGNTEAWIAVVPEPAGAAVLVVLAAWPLRRRARS